MIRVHDAHRGGRRVLRSVCRPDITEDARAVHRQAFAGLLWSKQFYHYDVNVWLEGDPAIPRLRRSARRAATRMDASLQCRRALHAGQMGISLVCRLGHWHFTAWPWR